MTATTPMADAAHIVPVIDFSRETLQNIIALLEISTDFEHLVYREAELDAIWSITGFFMAQEKHSDRFRFVERLHMAAQEAHDLVAEGRSADAAACLRHFLSANGDGHVVA
jgi:hypothetical protein